jgi:small subunit ribosomal protein S1
MSDWIQELEKHLHESLKEVKPGSIISGKIIKISENFAFVDIGLKKEALLPIEEIKDRTGEIILGEGDEIEALVMGKEPQEGFYILSFKKLREKKLWEELKGAYKEKRPVEVKVLALNKGGYEVEFGFLLKGFMPYSQAFFKDKPENLDSLIGKKIEVEILEIKNESFIASRRKILEKEYQRKKDSLINKIKAGEPIEGIVKKKVEGGFLIEIEEILTGFLPYKELDWKRIDNPSEYLKIGEKIKVKVLNYDLVKEKIKLSIKALLPDPWERVSQKYKEGDIVKGKVTQIFDFGAFMELEPGIEGFIPIKEITWNKKVKISEILEKGDEVSALILEIKPSERKILLSLIKLQPDPWISASKNYKLGEIVEGVIERFLPNGLLIELTSELTAFMPLKEFLKDLKAYKYKKELTEFEGFKIGDKIKGKIINIDEEKRKIQISYLKYLEDLENKEIEDYKMKAKETTFITFGEIFKKKIK